MKKLIVPILILLFTITASSQWVSNFGAISQGDINFNNAKGNAVTTDSYGNSYVTGRSYEGSNYDDIITIKYNPAGDTAWARTYNGTASDNDEGLGICVDGDGNVFVVGTTKENLFGNDLTILKYNSSGTFLWAKPFHSCELDKVDKGIAITVDRDQFIYVTGFTTAGDGTQNILLQKYDQEGGILWTKTEEGTSSLASSGQGIAVNTSGEIYVAGYIAVPGQNTNIYIMKYDGEGNFLWEDNINGTASSEDKAWGIVVDEEGDAYITGFVYQSTGNRDSYTARYSSSGTRLWSKTYNGGGNSADKAWGIVVDEDRTVYITGETRDEYQNVNYLTIKYDESGNEVWVNTYNGTGDGSDIASAIGLVTSPSNERCVIVTGKSWGTNYNYDYATVRYSAASSTQLLVNRYSMSGISNDVAKDVAVTEDNKVLITGYSQLIIEAMYEECYISTMALGWGESSELSSTLNNTPGKFALYQNYPNPFNPVTNIKFEIPASSQVKLVIYDMLGKVAAVLINQNLEAGLHNITYSNLNLSSGIYFYELTAGSFRDVKKMSLIK
jgi:uncharacterized delta-60 repeat protein